MEEAYWNLCERDIIFLSGVLLTVELYDEAQYHGKYKEKGWFESSLHG
jgi:hypothetical protein